VRVALVHDWLTGMRGGERVLERICALFPDADLFTLVWKRGSTSPAIERHRIATSFLDRLPGAERRYRWFLPLFPAAVDSLDLCAYDAVISSSHAVAKSARARAGALHLSYVFTPMRYVWDLEREYFPPGRFPWPLTVPICASLRGWDRATSRRPDTMIAISHHVAERIRRHYGRDAAVIYPPVELDRFTPASGPRDYYLLAGAMAPYKRGDLAIEACRRMGRRLVVAGTGPEEPRLRRLAGPDVEFRSGWIDDRDMAALYAGARGLLFPGEEDFGIVPVEAMASGCPVAAFGVGGAVETVGRGAPSAALAAVAAGGVARVPGGALFGRQTVSSLCEAIERLEAEPAAPEAVAACARPFAAPRFDAEFRAAFEALVSARSEHVADGAAVVPLSPV